MKIVHWNRLLLFVSKMGDSENEESGQDVSGLSDCIEAVSNNGEVD